MAETYTYTHADISRYLQKQMTKQEMYAFEKAMMEDPFLADALEGYENADQTLAVNHLNTIERQLTLKEQPAKVVVMSKANNNWRKVAAAVAVIAAAGIITYQSLNQRENKQLAAISTPEQKIVQDTIRAAEEPTTPPAVISGEKTLAANKPSPASPLPSPPAPRAEAATMAAPVQQPDSNPALALTGRLSGIQTEQAMRLDDDTRNKAAAKRMIASIQLDSTTGLQNQFTQSFKGRVLDERGNAVAFATINAGSDNATVADRDGNFTLKARDTVPNVNVQSLGYANTNTRLTNKVEDNVIVLKEAEHALAEVVVIGYGTQRKSALSEIIAGKKTPNPSGQNAEPSAGWESFQYYVYNSLKRLKDTSKTYTYGDVVLEFEVDSKGHPTEINVVESVNKANSEKATELLQKGPTWKRKNKKAKAKVVIRFEP